MIYWTYTPIIQGDSNEAGWIDGLINGHFTYVRVMDGLD